MSVTEKTRKKAIVVGAGVVGVCCAATLQRDGFAVTMFDPNGQGRGCAEGTVGIFATNIVAPASSANGVQQMLAAATSDSLDSPVVNKAYLPQLLPWFAAFVASAGPQSFAAGVQALKEAQALAVPALWDIMGEGVFKAHAKERGWLFAYESEDAFQRAQPDRDMRRRNGVVLEELTESGIRDLEPNLPSIFKRGTLFPRAYQTLNVHKFITAIGDMALRDGATLQQRAVDGIQVRGDGGFSVSAGGQTFDADVVVVAAGPGSAKLAHELGSPIPHSAERGYGVTFPNASVGLNRPVTFAKQKAVAAPMAAGLLLISTGEFIGPETVPDYRHAEQLAALGTSMFPNLTTSGMTRWFGDRSTTSDGLPVIGQSPHHKDLLFAFGHSHLGLTLAGLSGSIIAALVAGRAPIMDVTPFRADRFSLVPKV